MYNLNNLEALLNIELKICKGNQVLYGNKELNNKFEKKGYTLYSSLPLQEEQAELIYIVVKNNEKALPLWNRILKGEDFEQTEIPSAYHTHHKKSVWLIKSQNIYDEIELISALFEHSNVVPVSKDTLAVIYLFNEVITPETLSAHIEVETMKRARIIVGSTVDQLQDLKLSYEQAITIDKYVHYDVPIVIFDKILLEHLIGILDKGDLKKLFDDYSNLYPVQALTSELKETVFGFFKHNLNITDTANELFLHRNTLIYRLNKISQLTHLDIKNFEDAAKMKTLLLLDQQF